MAFRTHSPAQGGPEGADKPSHALDPRPSRSILGRLSPSLHPQPSRGPGRWWHIPPNTPWGTLAGHRSPGSTRGLRDPCQGPCSNGAERPEGPGHSAPCPPPGAERPRHFEAHRPQARSWTDLAETTCPRAPGGRAPPGGSTWQARRDPQGLGAAPGPWAPFGIDSTSLQGRGVALSCLDGPRGFHQTKDCNCGFQFGAMTNEAALTYVLDGVWT